MSSARLATFSALILNYNHSQYVLNSLNAAIEQTRPFDEILIVDDASTDSSVSVIQERIRDVPQARLIQNRENMGVIPSANMGLQQIKSDFVFYMSADDEYHPHIVEWCETILKNHPSVGMISGNTRICHADTGKERVFKLPFPQTVGCFNRADIEAAAQTRAFTFNIGANVLRRDAVLAAGQYVPALKWHCDWFLYLLVASRTPFGVVPEEFVRFRQSGSQYSSACFDWSKQRPVIESFIHTLKHDYPDDYNFFRKCALLPTYDLEALALCLTNPSFREYMTPLLLWRLLTYKILRLAGRLVPQNARAMIRRLVRV